MYILRAKCNSLCYSYNYMFSLDHYKSFWQCLTLNFVFYEYFYYVYGTSCLILFILSVYFVCLCLVFFVILSYLLRYLRQKQAWTQDSNIVFFIFSVCWNVTKHECILNYNITEKQTMNYFENSKIWEITHKYQFVYFCFTFQIKCLMRL